MQISSKSCNYPQLSAIQKIHPSVSAFGITSKTIYDGKRHDPSKTKHQLWGIHVETESSTVEHVTRAMKEILSGPSFKARCTIDVRLIPKISAEQDDITKSRIQRAIVQHSQVMANLGKCAVPGIQYLDGQINKKLATLRELILQLSSEIDGSIIFVSIDRNYSDTGFEIKYKVKYEKEAKIIASKLGAYLAKECGSAACKIFSAEY